MIVSLYRLYRFLNNICEKFCNKFNSGDESEI